MVVTPSDEGIRSTGTPRIHVPRLNEWGIHEDGVHGVTGWSGGGRCWWSAGWEAVGGQNVVRELL